MGSGGDERPPACGADPAVDSDPAVETVNSDGPDLLEMVFVALVLVAIAYSFTH
ncbi:MAG: hypothetical protein VKK97_11705 [Synechococcaceae cyanobacterium]|nr:hypothetical protein [Synechococcaceae cyanobacterium]